MLAMQRFGSGQPLHLLCQLARMLLLLLLLAQMLLLDCLLSSCLLLLHTHLH